MGLDGWDCVTSVSRPVAADCVTVRNQLSWPAQLDHFTDRSRSEHGAGRSRRAPTPRDRLDRPVLVRVAAVQSHAPSASGVWSALGGESKKTRKQGLSGDWWF